MTLSVEHLQNILTLIGMDIASCQAVYERERKRTEGFQNLIPGDERYITSLRVTFDILYERQTTYSAALVALKQKTASGSGFEPPLSISETTAMPTAARLNSMLRSVDGKFENLIPWRGSTSDVATDLAYVMDMEQMSKLVRELNAKIDGRRAGKE